MYGIINVPFQFAVSPVMVIHKVDHVTAVLNGELHKKIYMYVDQPERLAIKDQKDIVCNLKKLL